MFQNNLFGVNYMYNVPSSERDWENEKKKEKLIIGYKQNILQFPNLIRLDKIIDLFLNSIQKINGSYDDHFYILIWNATFCIIITMASLLTLEAQCKLQKMVPM